MSNEVKSELQQYSLSEKTPTGRIDWAINQVINSLHAKGLHKVANELTLASNQEVLALLKS